MNTSNLMPNSKRVAHIKSIKGINPLSTKMRKLKKKSTDRAKRANKIILLTLKKYSTTWDNHMISFSFLKSLKINR